MYLKNFAIQGARAKLGHRLNAFLTSAKSRLGHEVHVEHLEAANWVAVKELELSYSILILHYRGFFSNSD